MEVKTKENSKNKEKMDMSFKGHPVSSPTLVVPRKCRWTLTNEQHPNVHFWMKSLKTDYVNKNITLETYDDAKGDVFKWIQALLNDPKSHGPLMLSHYDGDGSTINVLEFSELKLSSHEIEYDYSSSAVLLNKLSIRYQKISQVPLHSENS